MSYDDDVSRNGPLLWPRPAKRPPIPDAPKLPPPRVTITTESEAAEFWKRLDEKSRLLLAKGAPLVVGSWTQSMDSRYTTWARDFAGDLVFAKVKQWHGDDDWDVFIRGDHVCMESSLAAAKAACDAKLRELGFVLEDGE